MQQALIADERVHIVNNLLRDVGVMIEHRIIVLNGSVIFPFRSNLTRAARFEYV